MGVYKKEEQYDSKNIESLKEHYSKVLELLGEDPSREGLIKTPERVAKAMGFLTHGYKMNATEILESAMFSENYSQMVLVKEIEFYSLCEHHLLPFFGKANTFTFLTVESVSCCSLVILSLTINKLEGRSNDKKFSLSWLST